jgi:predicted KAP-like P-loop ATPase
LLSDTPVTRRKQDYFGYAAHADAVAEVIDSERTDTPLTIAVTGAWGAGKTSLAVMVELRLREWTKLRRGERPIATCWFRAWLHDDAPHLGAALAAQVAREANRRRRWWQRVLFPVPEALLGPGERWRRRAALLLGLPR